jgi:iron-sulfur cluster assembly accessory protein
MCNTGFDKAGCDPIFATGIASPADAIEHGARALPCQRRQPMPAMNQSPNRAQRPAVTVSERAAKRIAEIAAGEPATPLLRISVEGGGCSGFSYKFDLVPASEPDDLVIERAGARVLVDPVSLEYLSGAEIDYVDDLIGSAFKVHNPNATASCGCGTSFAM